MAEKKVFLLGMDIDVKKAKEGLSSLIGTAGKLGGIFTGLGTGISAMMQNQFEEYKELNDTMKALGQNGSFAYKTINAAMSSEMTNANAVRGEIEGLSKAMLEMRTLGYTNNTGFAMIGASMNDSMDTLLQKTQKTMQYLTNTGQTAKAKKLADVLGANELYYVLRESNDVFNKMSKNGIINQKNLDQMQEVSKSWNYMTTQFSRMKMGLQMQLAPALTTMIKAIGDVITSEPFNTTIKIMAKMIGGVATFISKTPPTILSTILTAILVNKAAHLIGIKSLGSTLLTGYAKLTPLFIKGIQNVFLLSGKTLLLPFKVLLHPLAMLKNFSGVIFGLGKMLKSGFVSIIKTFISFGAMLLPHLIPIAIIGLGIMGILSIVRLIGKKFGLIDVNAKRGQKGQINDMFSLMDDMAEKRKANGENALVAELGAYKDIIQATYKGAMMSNQERTANSLAYYGKTGRLENTQATLDNIDYYKKSKATENLYQIQKNNTKNDYMNRNNITNNVTNINITTSKVDENTLKRFQRQQDLQNYNNLRGG